MRRLFLSLLIFAITLPASRSGQASLHLRRHDEAEARGRAGSFARRQVGDLQRGRCGFGSQHKDAAHLDRAACSWSGGRLVRPGRADRSLPIRTPTVHAGRRMASALRFSRRKKAARRSGLRISMASQGRLQDVHKLTSIATEAGGELWSPDGKNILFTSDVYPECDGAPAPEQNCNAKKLKEAEQSKVKAQIFTHLLYRHWNAYKEGKRSHIFVDVSHRPATNGAHDLRTSVTAIPRDLTPGDYDAPVFSLGGQDDYAFSPDGQEICYTSNHDKNPKPLPPTTICGSSRSPVAPPGTSPPTIPPATRRRSIRPMAATSPTAPSSVRDTRATASG